MDEQNLSQSVTDLFLQQAVSWQHKSAVRLIDHLHILDIFQLSPLFKDSPNIFLTAHSKKEIDSKRVPSKISVSLDIVM